MPKRVGHLYRTMCDKGRIRAAKVIARLEEMLRMALDIVNQQAQLLEQHGIETETGQLEAAEKQLRKDMEGWC